MREHVIFIAIAISLIITLILGPIFIPFLRKLKFGQSIREGEAPDSHKVKAGTPTMGGMMILSSLTIGTLMVVSIFSELSTEIYALLLMTLGFGLLGFLDDFIKVVLKRNLGLRSKQKLFGQIVISVLFCVIHWYMNLPTIIAIPGTSAQLDLGIFYFVFVIFWLVGFSNAVNLTDGLDGLLGGTAAVAFSAFAIVAWSMGQYDIALFCLTIVGASLGFLVFNVNPAKVFMGDTGSLALGGAIGAVSILLNAEILLVLIGGVFVIETLSVIIQVISFKTTGKRVFKMSPIHHHFELIGWSEWRVVATFWAVGFVLAIIGVYIGVWL